MCEMAHFGNCDPETADQEYCIFHKPNKTEEEAREFYNKFVLRFFGYKLPWNEGWVFAGPVNANEFVFPELLKTSNPQQKTGEEFSFERAVFDGSVSFDNAIFEGLVCFTEAEFNHFASFDNAQFKMEKVKAMEIHKFCDIYETFVKEPHEENSITETTAMPVVSFYKSKFRNGVSFYSATFLGIADFRGSLFEVNDGDELFFKSKYHQWVLTGATFNRAVFKRAVVFSNSKFRGGAEFSGTQFSWADFSNAQFEGENEKDVITNFRDSVFEIGADFSNARFKGTTVFVYTKIHRETKFNKAEFKGSENAEVAFKGALLENAEFGDAKFYTPAEFNSVDRITKIVNGNFVGCTFYKESRFYRVIFKGQTTFTRSTFKEGVAFDGSEFEKAIFNFATFEKVASFKNVIFHDEAWFQEVEFKKAVEFQAAEFKGKTAFKGSVFERVAVFVNEDLTLDEPTPKFHDELSFSNCDFRQGADFLGSLKEEKNLPTLWDFFSSRFSKLSALIEALRIQRLSFEKEGKRDEADRMFVLEMRAKRKLRLEREKDDGWNYINTKTRNFVEWLLGDLPSEYGTSIKRIAIAVVAVVVLFGFLYWLTLVSNIVGIASVFVIVSLLISIWHYQTFDNYPDKFAETLRLPVGLIIITEMLYATMSPRVDSIIARPQILLSNGTAITPTGSAGSYIGTLLNTLYYSLVTFTTLGYGDMHPTGWLKALSALEALTGAVFMALIVAVISRKWMR
ncbi:pentapeptide repeat-containing protein [Thermococcus sp.]|uniref:pentapeptide repeat-containing protein n=1 Tax=Thermococcus sp. TaxID=35749 RepID=UPI00262D6A99|nr:pentapeptide repeat-containing protein [Thermococcus sp.]